MWRERLTKMRTWKMEVGVHRKIGRPKLRWTDVVRNIKGERSKYIEEAQDRITSPKYEKGRRRS